MKRGVATGRMVAYNSDFDTAMLMVEKSMFDEEPPTTIKVTIEVVEDSGEVGPE